MSFQSCDEAYGVLDYVLADQNHQDDDSIYGFYDT